MKIDSSLTSCFGIDKEDLRSSDQSYELDIDVAMIRHIKGDALKTGTGGACSGPPCNRTQGCQTKVGCP